MRPTHVYIFSRAKWDAKYGKLPRDPLRSFDGAGLYNGNGEMWYSQNPDIMCKPYVIRDCGDHIGPSGRIVNGRSGKREEIKRSDGKLVDWEPVTSMPRGLANEAFATKHKAALKSDTALVKLNDKSRAWMESTMDSIDDGLAHPDSGRVKSTHSIADRELDRVQAEVLQKHGISST